VERKEDPMPKRRYTPEEIVAKLRQVDVLLGQGKTVGEAVKTIGVTETTCHRWRNEYGGLKLDQVKRLKELESENSRLRRAVSDLTLDKMILNEALRGKS
jgi:putative transposase